MKMFFCGVFLVFALLLCAAPDPFILSPQLANRTTAALKEELKKSNPPSIEYTRTAMKILEERIRLRMKLLKFDLIHNEALEGMKSPEDYKVQDLQISLTPAERRKVFSRHRDKISLLIRYNKSCRIRNEVIELFRQCRPPSAENRFHSEFFSLLEFQHIYLEMQIQNLRKTLR